MASRRPAKSAIRLKTNAQATSVNARRPDGAHRAASPAAQRIKRLTRALVEKGAADGLTERQIAKAHGVSKTRVRHLLGKTSPSDRNRRRFPDLPDSSPLKMYVAIVGGDSKRVPLDSLPSELADQLKRAYKSRADIRALHVEHGGQMVTAVEVEALDPDVLPSRTSRAKWKPKLKTRRARLDACVRLFVDKGKLNEVELLHARGVDRWKMEIVRMCLSSPDAAAKLRALHALGTKWFDTAGSGYVPRLPVPEDLDT